MKFLLDQGLPRATVGFLAARGITAAHLGDLGMAAATDQAVLDYAAQTSAAVVTFDADFHRLLAHSGARCPSVVRIREEGLKGNACADVLAQVTRTVGIELTQGAMISVSRGRIRVRMLPL